MTTTEDGDKNKKIDSSISSSSDVIVPIIDEIRDHLVTTAVKFLQNPKVRSTSLRQKQEFLRKKGLTETEIDLACHQASVYDEEKNNVSKVLALQYPTSTKTRTSLLLKAMDVANMIALISIGSYSLYSLWKNFAPRIFGTRSRLEQKYERLLESITQLNQNVVELRELFRDLQLQSISSSSKSQEIQEFRKEIAAIKSLLLGRSQFPSPATSTGIPSWQMVEGVEGQEGDISNDNSDEGSSRRRPSSNKKDKSSNVSSISSRKFASSITTTMTSSSLPEGGGTVEDEELPGGSGSTSIRKHPSLDSNNGFHSESSCEVVFVGKNDSSDPDHESDDF